MESIHKQEHNIKDIEESIQKVITYQEEKPVQFSLLRTENDKIEAIMKKNEIKGYLLEFENNKFHYENMGSNGFLQLSINGKLYESNDLFIKSISYPKVKGVLSHFYSKGFSKNISGFFRLIIPIDRKIDFIYCLESRPFRTKIGNTTQYYSFNYVSVKFDNALIDLYTVKINEKKFLIIDALSESIFLDFEKYCFAAINTMGFITGSFPQDEAYFFTFEDSQLKNVVHSYYTELRKSIYAFYKPIYTDPYGYIRKREDAEKYKNKLKLITEVQFGKLANKIFMSSKFSSIIILILESSVASLLFMPSGFSVALEGLADIITGENVDKIAPIKSKSLAQLIRKEFKEIIEKHKNEKDKEGRALIDEVGLKILNSRIDGFNQLTNSSKLLKPFELLNIELTQEDERIINYRNDFLHGRINLEASSNTAEDLNNVNKEIHYISLRLYTLLCALILKSVGFEDMILNFPKIYELSLGRTLNEECYRQI